MDLENFQFIELFNLYCGLGVQLKSRLGLLFFLSCTMTSLAMPVMGHLSQPILESTNT